MAADQFDRWGSWLRSAPGGPATVAAALDVVEAIDDITVVAVEIALRSAGFEVGFLDALPGGLDVYIEIPRGDDRPAVFDIVAERGFHAKFRTGGITSDLVPGESELATAIHTAVTRYIRFKATAALHHAIRNTDCRTGFEQHGFLNMLLAAQAASDGAAISDLEHIRAQRDAAVIVDEIRKITQPRMFGSFGTCDIAELCADLVSLALTKGYR